MKIRTSYMRYAGLMTAVRNVIRTEFGGAAEIYEDTARMPEFGGEIVFGVNWPGIGTVDSETALEFASNIQNIAHLARFLNSIHIVVDYTAEDNALDRNAFLPSASLALINMHRLELTSLMDIDL